MAEHNIVVLGAGPSGLGITHNALRHIVPAVRNKTSVSYKVILVNPASNMYYIIGAPRAMISEELWPIEKSFGPIAEHFASYSADAFEFVQASATGVDTDAREITVQSTLDQSATPRTINYDALVIATGASSDNPLWGVRDSEQATRDALHDMHKRLPSAESVVVVGGGPAGVETAGELGFEFGKKKDITLLSGASRLLTNVRKDIGQQAENYLKGMNVNVQHDVRVLSAQPAGGKTSLTLSDGSTLSTDVYIDATGLKPNTKFVPQDLLTERGTVKTDPLTLRVPSITKGHVYAIGSAASYSAGGMIDATFSIVPLSSVIEHDLSDGKGAQEKPYKRIEKEMLIAPVGRSKGVGVIFGFKVPSFLAWGIKGRDYLSSSLYDHLTGKSYAKKGW